MTKTRTPRLSPRYEIDLPVDMRFGRSDLRLFGRTVNMSATGLLILSEDPKPPGTPVHLKLDEFEGWAEVVWQRTAEVGGALVGMRFTRMDADDRSKLEDLLRNQPLAG